jgi:ketosteroid isomerase-like protein
MSNANVTHVQSMYAAFGRGDIATVVAGCTPDIDWHSGSRPDHYPSFGPRKGQNAVEEFFKIVGENNEFSEFSPREFYAIDDKVFVLGDFALTIRKSGRQFASDWVHIFTIRDGKVARFREFLDTAGAVEAWQD